MTDPKFLGVPFFKVESAKIEGATFPYKTAMSEANVNTRNATRCNYGDENFTLKISIFLMAYK